MLVRSDYTQCDAPLPLGARTRDTHTHMKPSDARARGASDDDDNDLDADDLDDRSSRREGNAENRKRDGERGDQCDGYCVGARVERELDGLWFPATIVAVDSLDGTFELEYDEDHNRETDITAEELRFLDESRKEQQPARQSSLTPQQRELLFKDSLLLQTCDYDPNKRPTVVLHHQGESNAAAGYIINGLENNIAAGNGLRGIRWLRVNTF